jgi:ribose transport system substrate-binding protein
MKAPNSMRAVLLLGVAAWLAPVALAQAEDFHGFDPDNFNGAMLSAEQLQAMVKDAIANHKPRSGGKIVVGFANLQRDITFCVTVEQSLIKNAQTAGVDLQVADNRLDGATALANAESFIQRNVDYVIEFQTDANFGATIMQKMNDADTKVTAIDIPMPGASFFGANNPRSGFMGGSYLAQAAVKLRDADAVKKGYLVVGELPQSGAIPAMRTNGQIAGFLADAGPDFPKDHIIKIDTKNTLQESFAQMTNVLPRIPEGVPIMVTAINDQSATGMLHAVQQAGREKDLIVVGMGADETEALVKEKSLVASVGYFPERYGNYLVPLALMSLSGKTLPPSTVMNHVMVTKANVCDFYPSFKCDPAGAAIDYKFPQAAYEAYVKSLRADPDLKDYQALIPAK